MARLLTVAFLAGAGLFCGYAIGHRPHPGDYSWMRRSAAIEDRRDDLSALSAGLPGRVAETFATVNAHRTR